MKEYSLIKRRNKFIAIIVVLFLVITILPTTIYAEDGHSHNFDDNGGCVCGAHTNMPQDHSDCIALSQSDFLLEVSNDYYSEEKHALIFDDPNSNDEVKNYYLSEDITFDMGISDSIDGFYKSIILGSFNDENNKGGTVNLCLNGHVFKAIGVASEEYNSSVIKLTNGIKLNIYDCGETQHSIGDSVVYGGVFTGSASYERYFDIRDGSHMNMYGGSIVGNSNIYDMFNISETNSGFLNIFGTNIYDNHFEKSGSSGNVIGASKNSEINIVSCNIINNYCENILDISNNCKCLLLNSYIVENDITHINDVANAFAVICTDDATLTLSGNTIVKDNLCNGLQRNICCCNSDNIYTYPFYVDNLTSSDASIGVSTYTALKPTTESKICIDGAAIKEKFFSDDFIYYISTDGQDLCLKSRVLEEPSLDNNYKFDLYTGDLHSTSYQWYSGSIEETELNMENTFPELGGMFGDNRTYNNGVWTSSGRETFPFFDFQAEKDTMFKCDVDFGDINVQDEVYNLIVIDLKTNNQYSDLFTENGEFIYTLEQDARYSVVGCFGREESPKLKNTRLEKFNISGSVAGQTTDTFTNTDEGYYYCEAKIKDSSGNSRIISSDIIEIAVSGYRIIEKPDIININTTSDCFFTSDVPYNQFLSVEINGSPLSNDKYDCINDGGSTKIVLHSSYLKSLKVGEYTLKIVSQDGNASAKFTITKNSKPSSGGGTTSYSIPKTGIK